MLRNFRRQWRRTRWRRATISFILAAAAIIGGTYTSMYFAGQRTPTPDDLGVVGR